jgi:serine/threonine-protein kinase PknK
MDADFPVRYAPVSCLGSGGGGEVWHAVDSLNQQPVALKLLRHSATAVERDALVREASALSALEGLGVPAVLGFGRTPHLGRTFLVRELVLGRSLDAALEAGDLRWLQAFCDATAQVTILHRNGLLHGDLKPANIIIGDDGRGTLVDLGLAAPLNDGGSAPRGLTPKYAAPELLAGAHVGVRTEVYALGVTLREAVTRASLGFKPVVRAQLTEIANTATATNPEARFPSVDELEGAVRRASGLLASVVNDAQSNDRASDFLPWPMHNLDRQTRAALAGAEALLASTAMALCGPAGAGRTTLIRRLAWTLGLAGDEVLLVEPRLSQPGASALMTRAARRDSRSSWWLIDDFEELSPDDKHVVHTHLAAGGRVIAVVGPDVVGGKAALTQQPAEGATTPAGTDTPHFNASYTCIPLDALTAQELLAAALPALPSALVPALLARAAGRPGALRQLAVTLRQHVVISERDLDAVLALHETPHRESTVALEALLDRGRFAEAQQLLATLPQDTLELRFARSFALARIALAAGDTEGASRALADSAFDQASGELDAAMQLQVKRSFHLLMARVRLREFALNDALAFAATCIETGASPQLPAVVDALCVRGIALAYQGQNVAAHAALQDAVNAAIELADSRLLAIANASLAFTYQIGGDAVAAKRHYADALTHATVAEDAWTVASTRLNLASLARTEGDLASALEHLEAAAEMGRTAGAALCTEQAQLNLANLDLLIGRIEHAAATLSQLDVTRCR